MASPPKPWERAGTGMTASSAAPSPAPTPTPPSSVPPLPQRPSTLAASVNQNAAAYSMGGMPSAAASPYGAYGSAYQSPYASPYSRLGAYGGGYGGYGGGMYGGYGGMYGGAGMYGAVGGMMGNPGDPNSLTSRFSQSTATTFQMLEGVVGAFGGFAQMLESTYMATHSSFFAMISVAEQFATLRDTLGSILGIFTLVRWLRTLIARLTGRPLPADAKALTPASFARFEGRAAPAGAPADRPRASRKPLLFFLLAAFGLPYLLSKMIRMVASQGEEEHRRMALQQGAPPVDPSKMEFCRVVYDYTPEAGFQGQDLAVHKGDLVAVLGKEDPFGNPIDWWKCRTRDGRIGFLPSSYLETIQKARAGAPQKAIKASAASESSRANSVTSGSVIESVSTSVPDKEPVMASKGAASVLDNFQKSQFYS